MRTVKPYSTAQFAVFRIVFGLFLIWHFVGLMPHADESSGTTDLSAVTKVGVIAGVLLAGLLTVGWRRPVIAVLLCFGWAASINRATLTDNASPLFVGVLLVVLAIVPDGEPWRWRGKAVRPSAWFLPAAVYGGTWGLLATGYMISGLSQLSLPGWWDGSAWPALLDFPLIPASLVGARFPESSAGVQVLFASIALAAQTTFLPLSVYRRGRAVAWTAMVVLLAITTWLLDFSGPIPGLLLVHLFLFDPAWLPARPTEGRTPVLLYDGECGLCNAVVRFLLREDTAGTLRFAPLQSATGQAFLRTRDMNPDNFESMVFIPDLRRPVGADWKDGRDFFQRTDGVVRVLDQIGGLWRVVSWFRIVPHQWRDAAYRIVARLRYRLFGAYHPTPYPEPTWTKRILP